MLRTSVYEQASLSNEKEEKSLRVAVSFVTTTR